MADIDPRVRLLTDLLMAQRFAWVASEIIEAIEVGFDEGAFDQDVEFQRKRLDLRAIEGIPAESIDKAGKAWRRPIEQKRRQYLPDEQVRVAVNIFVDRLASAAEMVQKSASVLNEIMNAAVLLHVEIDGEARPLDSSGANIAAERLRSLQNEFLEWLLSYKDEK
jgi:hypothetical protein